MHAVIERYPIAKQEETEVAELTTAWRDATMNDRKQRYVQPNPDSRFFYHGA